MILYKEETVQTAIHVPVNYPSYYHGRTYNNHYVAVFSDTLAVQVCVLAYDMKLYQGTPADVFKDLPFEDFQRVEEKVFIRALESMYVQLYKMVAKLRATNS
jgi:hypothetical protein